MSNPPDIEVKAHILYAFGKPIVDLESTDLSPTERDDLMRLVTDMLDIDAVVRRGYAKGYIEGNEDGFASGLAAADV